MRDIIIGWTTYILGSSTLLSAAGLLEGGATAAVALLALLASLVSNAIWWAWLLKRRRDDVEAARAQRDVVQAQREAQLANSETEDAEPEELRDRPARRRANQRRLAIRRWAQSGRRSAGISDAEIEAIRAAHPSLVDEYRVLEEGRAGRLCLDDYQSVGWSAKRGSFGLPALIVRTSAGAGLPLYSRSEDEELPYFGDEAYNYHPAVFSHESARSARLNRMRMATRERRREGALAAVPVALSPHNIQRVA